MAGRGDERGKIAARIRALRAKTVENGCTEAEALAAAALAADLLRRHDMDLDEAELRETPYGEREWTEPDDVGDRLWRPADAIAALTHCRYWQTGPGTNPVRITFLGLEHEVEVAVYLAEICARAMRDGAAGSDRTHALRDREYRRRRRRAFLDGMSESLARRIRAMIPPRPAGTGLVVLRDALIEAEMERRGHRLKDLRGGLSRDFDPAFDAGYAAGDRVALDPGLRGPSGGAALIGARRAD